MGPIGTFTMANITAGHGGRLAEYSDAELRRLIKHGIKRDGKSVLFMPSQDFNWWPEEDLTAIVSYLRTVPNVHGQPATVEVGTLGKILDRLDKLPLHVARRIDHTTEDIAPPPGENAQYGAYVARLCMGCHGTSLAGGPIPGAPSSLPVPLNLTPHETGLSGWTFADFQKLMREGIRKNGQKLDPFMPTETTKNFNDTEMAALWAYLQTLPPTPLGER
jgi:mono/diheme cytochrome c family protein